MLFDPLEEQLHPPAALARKLSLTEEGAVFYARCKDLLANVDEAEAEITSRTGEASGLLKVNVPVSFGIIHLAPLWAEFMARHPRVRLDVTLSDRVVDLVEEGFEWPCASPACRTHR
ncbi:MAG: LysR substrate-binding domain-containing protein [Burkholderiales bacterium]